MGNTLKARPTEYRGVVYRSKCEAMFARYLELQLSGCSVAEYLYEPIEGSGSEWTPDFFYAYSVASPAMGVPPLRFSVPAIAYRFAEYKPSKPTKTYVKEFSKNAGALLDSFEHIYWMIPALRVNLFYGSVYNSDRGIISVRKDLCIGGLINEFDDTDWLGDFAEDIRSTRFDLEAN